MDIDHNEDGTRSDPTDADVEQTLREVRAFLDDPTALLERAITLLRERSASGPTP